LVVDYDRWGGVSMGWCATGSVAMLIQAR
jgi:hypothetical protein